jgi:hypothetical protein
VRYYAIKLTTPAGALYVPPSLGDLQLDGGVGGASFTSFTNGKTIPGAWNIGLDLPVIDAATSQGFATLRVWGISVAEIAQANNLAGNLSEGLPGYNIAIYGGMKPGLPLATELVQRNPKASGLLFQGSVYQCFGNWIETDMTLEFVIMQGQASTPSKVGGIGTLAIPKNFVWNWPAGQQMSVAIKNCLETGCPGVKVNPSISQSLVRNAPDPAFYPTLEQLAQYVNRASRDILKMPGYRGVSIVPAGSTFLVYDVGPGSAKPTGPVTNIAFQDLIGQPTWIAAPLIQFKTVMRADLVNGALVKLPPALTTNTQAAASSLINQKAAFQGTFQIVSLRHVGDFRNPSADAWVTIVEALPSTVTG